MYIYSAKAIKVSPESLDDWCKKALRLYDPSDDYDNLMKNPELIPTLGDDHIGGGSVVAYSAKDDSSSASTLPNELFFGMDPFDLRAERYEAELAQELGAITGTENEDWVALNKALNTTLEKPSKFEDITRVYAHQFGHYKHINELFLENILQSSNDFLALEYLQHLSKPAKKKDKDKEHDDGTVPEKLSIWENLKNKAVPEFRDKNPANQLVKEPTERGVVLDVVQVWMFVF
ncbi:hypothetical protein RFI_14690, partial [Reticulomyxa filosa]